MHFRDDGTLSTHGVEGPAAERALEGEVLPLIHGAPTSWHDLSAVAFRGPASITGTARLEERMASATLNPDLSLVTHLRVTVDETIDVDLLSRLLFAATPRLLHLEGERERCERFATELRARSLATVRVNRDS